MTLSQVHAGGLLGESKRRLVRNAAIVELLALGRIGCVYAGELRTSANRKLKLQHSSRSRLPDAIGIPWAGARRALARTEWRNILREPLDFSRGFKCWSHPSIDYLDTTVPNCELSCLDAEVVS